MLAAAAIAVAAAGGAAPVVGGAPAGDAAVVLVEIDAGTCTGAVVAPTVVLTAAHCAVAAGGTVSVGAAAPFDEVRGIVAVLVHRRYVGPGGGADLALLRVDPPLTPAPLAWRRAALPAMVGVAVRVIGFGRSDPDDPGSDGARLAATLTVRAEEGEHLIVGEPTINTCQGDSGGPAIAELGEGAELVAVVSDGDAGCAGDARLVRLDRHAAWVDEVVAAWSGPCAADGACVTDGCGAWPDPDCDPCGLDGTCAAGCARVDLDCPLAGLPGAPCDDDLDCEDRACVPAPEDPRWSFCSVACEPAAGGADCPAPLGACDAGVCVYAGITPGVIGAPCAGPGDCRSGICDEAVGACAEPCGAGGACPAGFSCEPVGAGEACTTPPAGCCAAGGAHGPGAALLALGVALALRRRQDAARRCDRSRSGT